MISFPVRCRSSTRAQTLRRKRAARAHQKRAKGSTKPGLQVEERKIGAATIRRSCAAHCMPACRQLITGVLAIAAGGRSFVVEYLAELPHGTSSFSWRAVTPRRDAYLIRVLAIWMPAGPTRT